MLPEKPIHKQSKPRASRGDSVDGKAKKRKTYPTPWRRVSGKIPLGKFEVYLNSQGGLEVFGLQEVIYRCERFKGRFVTERRVERTPSLARVLQHLTVPEHEHALIALASGAFASMERLFELYGWQMLKKEEKRKEDEKKKRATKKAKSVVADKHAHRMRMVDDRQFCRQVEL